MLDKQTEQKLRELHSDLSEIQEKAPEMMDVLRGVIKGIRIASEAAAAQTTPPQATA
ncbi:MAG: hypothetical protein Q4A32_11630 [Lachnospiraceae bacterium]|nr:hypothetical protein [Lachnospiraceae bacterium]